MDVLGLCYRLGGLMCYLGCNLVLRSNTRGMFGIGQGIGRGRIGRRSRLDLYSMFFILRRYSL